MPRNEVIAKFDNENNLEHWQKGLVSQEHISGTKGEVGAVTKLRYAMGKQQLEMIETITFKNLPEAIHLTFDTKNVYNIQQNYFEATTAETTTWISKNEFKFSGFMKFVGFLMSKAFKKQTILFMKNFKAFAEEGKSVLDN